jgi:pseudaminic acid cytidylyltransferase
MRVAIIPARGASKRIPRKNIRTFVDKPMIAHSILAAKASDVFDRILVSTDDEEIGEVARQWGAEVPFKRPAELSDDHATTVDAVAHTVDWLLKMGTDVSFACCIYATAPLIRPQDIAGALEQIEKTDWSYVFPATTFSYSIFRAIQIGKNHQVKMFFPEHTQTRSQDLPEAWHDAGQFYWGRRDAWLNRVPIIGDASSIFPISRKFVQDIDTFEDWTFAEQLYKNSLESHSA